MKPQCHVNFDATLKTDSALMYIYTSLPIFQDSLSIVADKSSPTAGDQQDFEAFENE